MEEGDLVVSGEEGDAEEHAGEGGVGPGPALGGAELEEEDEGAQTAPLIICGQEMPPKTGEAGR